MAFWYPRSPPLGASLDLGIILSLVPILVMLIVLARRKMLANPKLDFFGMTAAQKEEHAKAQAEQDPSLLALQAAIEHSEPYQGLRFGLPAGVGFMSDEGKISGALGMIMLSGDLGAADIFRTTSLLSRAWQCLERS